MNNMFTYCTSNVLYSETTLHKTFHKYNVINIEFYIFFILFNTIFHTAPFIYLECKFYKKLIWDLRGVLQIGVYLYNKLLGNTYVKGLPQLCYSWFYFYFNMYNFGS